MLLAGCPAPVQQITAADPRPELLRQLDGAWVMEGTIRDKPVMYNLQVQSTLQGRFSELHMIDTAFPPQYEARVFIGYDSDSRSIYTHWLDLFGAGASVPHGEGYINGDTLLFVVPYPGRPFRDVFVLDRRQLRWDFLIESSSDSVQWEQFARYTIRRR